MNRKDGFFGKLLPGNLHSIRNLFWKIEYIFLSDYQTGLPLHNTLIHRKYDFNGKSFMEIYFLQEMLHGRALY